MKVHVYFLLELLLVLNMCFQANRGVRGGAVRRITRLISHRIETQNQPPKSGHRAENLIVLTPEHDTNIVSRIQTRISRSECSTWPAYKHKQKLADSLDLIENFDHKSVFNKNLIQIKCENHVSTNDNFSIGLLNCQSLKNKTNLISDKICEKRVAMLFLTETWIRAEIDDLHLKNASPPGYSYLHKSRPTGRRGGGVGVIVHNGIITSDKTAEFKLYSSFELFAVQTNINGKPSWFYLLYRPPPSVNNDIKRGQFLPEFTDFLESAIIRPGNICILGDFNIAWDKTEDTERSEFASLLSSFGLLQHVKEQTHTKGHTIDFIITLSDANLLTHHTVDDLLSDHYLVQAFLKLSKPEFQTKVVKYRKIKAIDLDAFSNDITNAVLKPEPEDDVDIAMDKYTTILRQLLDKHAPEKTAKITIRPKQPWYDSNIKTAKQKKRQAERKLRAKRKAKYKLRHQSKSAAYKTLALEVSNAQTDYIQYRNCLVNAIDTAKQTYYTSRKEDCGTDQKKLFLVLNELTHKQNKTSLPDHSSEEKLAETFNNFFIEKIKNIRKYLDITNSSYTFSENAPETHMDTFEPCTEHEIEKIIKNSSNASCDLDPVPTLLVKKCLPALLPFLTHLTNLSLQSGFFPDSLKTALVRPLLKKPTLDYNELKNFRPVSNIPFISKIIKKNSG